MNTRVIAVLALAALCMAANYKKEFAGKVALVTGGSSGIGFQTALEFAQYGAKVIIVARDSNPNWFTGAGAVEKITNDPVVQQSGGQCRFIKADVSDREQMKGVIDDIRSKEGDLDFAVNAAGIGGPLGLLADNRAYINGTHCPMRNNIYGTLFSLIYELRFMNENNHPAAIVNFASVNGLQATPKGSLYGASKFGIVGLTRCAAAEHAVAAPGAPLIRINAVAPGLTDTSLTWQQVKYFAQGIQPWEGDYITPDSQLWKDYGPMWVAQLVAKVMASPKNMADAALFLCSSDASFITGHILSVDRGATA